VEAEGRGELEAGQNENLAHQLPVFREKLAFRISDPAELLEIDQVFELVFDADPTGDGVVIGEGDDIQTLACGASQDVYWGDPGLLVVDRARGVDMQIGPVPLQLAGVRGRCRIVGGRATSRTRTAASSWLANGNLLSGGSASQIADKWPKPANSARSLPSSYHRESA
jgi:hypothetical protein